MASSSVGFEEFEMSLEKIEPLYRQKSVEILNSLGTTARGAVMALTPQMQRAWGKRKKGELKNSWAFLPTKYYQGDKVAVVKIQSDIRYAHLVENDHEVITTGRKLSKKVAKSSIKDLKEARVKHHGKRAGNKMLERTFKSLESNFNSRVNKMFDEITQESSV